MRKRKKANKTMSVQKRDVSHTPSHSFTHLPSSSPVIRVHNLGKHYRIGKLRGYKTFRETIVDVATAPFRHLRSGVKNLTNKTNETNQTNKTVETDGHIWALKDVSFEVQEGEVLGIIGRNGAGKTTLLKVLSRITEPTKGRVELKGRVGSLLEVGTGFHPELTGRENIYLNGAILGMKRAEIKKKFDEIVAFAEIEKFLDTPVKRYSSGMYVRLAFAVAAHLEPEILLVDEVLAVGDAAFQKKCLGKMGEVAKSGRTVLFVSHNMGAIRQLCERGIILDCGRIQNIGCASEMVQLYMNQYQSSFSIHSFHEQLKHLKPDPTLKVHGVWVSTSLHKRDFNFRTHKNIFVGIEYEIIRPSTGLRVGFDFYTVDGTFLFRSFDDDLVIKRRQIGLYKAYCRIPGNLLNSGIYIISFAIGIHNVRWIINGEVQTKIEVVQTDGVNKVYVGGGSRPGYLLPAFDWKEHRLDK